MAKDIMKTWSGLFEQADMRFGHKEYNETLSVLDQFDYSSDPLPPEIKVRVLYRKALCWFNKKNYEYAKTAAEEGIQLMENKCPDEKNGHLYYILAQSILLLGFDKNGGEKRYKKLIQKSSNDDFFPAMNKLLDMLLAKISEEHQAKRYLLYATYSRDALALLHRILNHESLYTYYKERDIQVLQENAAALEKQISNFNIIKDSFSAKERLKLVHL